MNKIIASKISLAVVIVVLVAIGLLIFKSLLKGNFAMTDSISFIISAAVIIAIALVFTHKFVPTAVRGLVNFAVVAIVVLPALWSITQTTSEPVAAATQDSATGYGVLFANWFRLASPLNDEVALQADRECDLAIAKLRKTAEGIYLQQFEQDGDVEAYAKKRKTLAEKLVIAKGCKSSGSIELPHMPDLSAIGNSLSKVDKSYNVTVPANVKWYRPPVSLEGKRVKISRQSGEWTNGGSKPIYTDANGSGSWNGLLVPSAPFRALVGRVNGQSGFTVGNSWVGVVNGSLELSINDTDSFFDNKGSQNLLIEVE